MAKINSQNESKSSNRHFQTTQAYLKQIFSRELLACEKKLRDGSEKSSGEHEPEENWVIQPEFESTEKANCSGDEILVESQILG